MTKKEFSETEVNEIISRVVKVPGTMKDYQIQLVLEGFKAGQESIKAIMEYKARQDERKKVLE
jgi:hypothetical protein